MNKTLHKKLTEKHVYSHTPLLVTPWGNDPQGSGSEYLRAGLEHEMRILQAASKDLLQPRKEAIANILKMAREL